MVTALVLVAIGGTVLMVLMAVFLVSLGLVLTVLFVVMVLFAVTVLFAVLFIVTVFGLLGLVTVFGLFMCVVIVCVFKVGSYKGIEESGTEVNVENGGWG